MARIDKNKVKYLYLIGFNAVEIAERLEANIEAVRKCIQRNYSNSKVQHNLAALEKKEVIRAVNYESNKYMSNKTFIKKNRSIYRTKLNGDIVINREVAPIVTWDTPNRLANENKFI